MRKFIVAFMLLVLQASGAGGLEVPIRFDFEGNSEGWAIPDWSLGQNDYVGRNVSVSSEEFSVGKASLKLACDFPGDAWTAAIIEYDEVPDTNIKGYKYISVDVYIPDNAPSGFLAGKIIMTIAGSSQWIEMRKAVPLKPGKWVNIKAPLERTSRGELKYWQSNKNEKLYIDRLGDIKSIAIRIEYDVNRSKSGPAYMGDVYIDSVIIE